MISRDLLSADGLGAPFRPREIRFVDELPKTRNQKVMRRVLRALLSGSDPGDTSALADPELLPKLQAALTEAFQA